MNNFTLLLCRPQLKSEAFRQALASKLAQPFKTVISPAFEIESLDLSPLQRPYQYLLFTSQTAAERAKELGLKATDGVLCVGDTTAKAAQGFGYSAQSAGGNVDALIKHVAKIAPIGPLLHVSGEQTAGDLSGALDANGFDCDRLVVYRQLPLQASETFRDVLKGSGRTVLPVFSPLSAGILNKLEIGTNVRIVAMSEAVARSIDGSQMSQITIAERPTMAEMLSATLKEVAS